MQKIGHSNTLLQETDKYYFEVDMTKFQYKGHLKNPVKTDVEKWTLKGARGGAGFFEQREC
jgi:hypothetical protein